MKFSMKSVAIILILFVIGGVYLFKLTGNWNTESDKTPAVFTNGEFKGESNPSDIRGSYTFKNVQDSFNVPLEDLAKAFGLNTNEDISMVKLKELEKMYDDSLPADVEIGPGAVKYFVALYCNLPYESSASLPTPAVELLKEKGLIDEDMYSKLLESSIDIN